MDFFPGSALSMLIIRDSHPPCFIYISKFIITNDGNFFSHTSGCDTPSIIFPPKLNGYFLHSADAPTRTTKAVLDMHATVPNEDDVVL
jgi:hypothetical protein